MPLETTPIITPVEAFGILVLGGFIYFLPGFIAIFRYHTSVRAIFLFLVVFGFTGIGWLIALIWALSGQPDVDVDQMRKTVVKRKRESEREARKRERDMARAARRTRRKASTGAEPAPAMVEAAPPTPPPTAVADPAALVRQIWEQAGDAGEESRRSLDDMRADLVRMVENRSGQEGEEGGPAMSDMLSDNGSNPDPRPDETTHWDLAEDDLPVADHDATVWSNAPVPTLDNPGKKRKCPRCRETRVPVDTYCPLCGYNYA